MKQAATWPKHSILQMSKLGYQSMYFCSLATTVCLYSSIGISFKSIKKENEIRTAGRLTGIAQNQKKS